MPDPRTERIAELAEQLTALDPPAVRIARQRVERARADLHGLLRGRAAAHVVDAHRYRLERARDALTAAWRAGLPV